jgi:hypothetical protein
MQRGLCCPRRVRKMCMSLPTFVTSCAQSGDARCRRRSARCTRRHRTRGRSSPSIGCRNRSERSADPGAASTCCPIAASLSISDFSFSSFSLIRTFFNVSVFDGSCRSAVSSWLRYPDTLSSNCLRRRSIFALVKFLSRLFTALNLLPWIATLAFKSRPIRRHSSTNRAQTFLMAPLLSLLRNRLVVRRQPTEQPHHLDVAPRFAFQPPARLYPVEVAIDVELHRPVAAGDPVKPSSATFSASTRRGTCGSGQAARNASAAAV